MARQQIHATARDAVGKGAARKLRGSGRVPAVMYGHAVEAVRLSVDRRTLEKASRLGTNEVFDLQGVGGERPVLIRDLQRDPVSQGILHCDFYAVNIRETVEVDVAIHFEGEPVGVKSQGGVFERVLRDLPVRCLPLSIPDSLELDVSGLEIGDAVHVSDISVPEGVEVLVEPELTVAHVTAPRVEAEEAPAEGEEGAEAPAEAAEGESAAEAPAEGGESEGS